MKEYFKMYGLNFVDVSPEEFADISDKDPKVLYIIAPQNYDNYTGAYSVDLYLGNTKLGNIPEIKDITTNVWNLSEGIYKIYGELVYGDAAADKIGSLSNNQFGLLLVSKPTADSTVFTNIYDGNVYLGKTSTINGAHIKDYFKLLEDTSNKVSAIDQSNINDTNYASTQAVANYVNTHLLPIDTSLNLLSDNAIANKAVANAFNLSRSPFTVSNIVINSNSFKDPMYGMIRTIYRNLFHSVEINAETNVQLTQGNQVLVCGFVGSYGAPDNTKALSCSINAYAEITENGYVYITPNENINANTKIAITGIYYSAPSATEYMKSLSINMTNIISISVTDFFGRPISEGVQKIRTNAEVYIIATVNSGFKLNVEGALPEPNTNISNMYIVNSDVIISAIPE